MNEPPGDFVPLYVEGRFLFCGDGGQPSCEEIVICANPGPPCGKMSKRQKLRAPVNVKNRNIVDYLGSH